MTNAMQHSTAIRTPDNELISLTIAVGTWLGGVFASAWLAVPVTAHLLLGMMALDILSGVALAVIKKRLCTQALGAGVIRKVLILAVISAAHVETIVLHASFDIGLWVANIYIAIEGISIVRNAARAGVPVPKQFLDILVRAKNIAGPGGRS